MIPHSGGQTLLSTKDTAQVARVAYGLRRDKQSVEKLRDAFEANTAYARQVYSLKAQLGTAHEETRTAQAAAVLNWDRYVARDEEVKVLKKRLLGVQIKTIGKVLLAAGGGYALGKVL